jgi:hypothetical protein
MFNRLKIMLKNPLIKNAFAANCGIGTYRGMEAYKHRVDPEEMMYKNQIIHGALGAVIYANPVCWPLLINKEAERLEIHLRNLEIDDNYYNIF